MEFTSNYEVKKNSYRAEDDLSENDITDYDPFIGKQLKNKIVIIDRLVRETKISRDLKIRYGNLCQVCKTPVRVNSENYLSEGHHLQPYNRVHQGDDVIENMIILCPNHHSQFDRLYYAIEPLTHLVHCQNKDDENHLKKIFLLPGHILGEAYLQYVWDKFCDVSREADKIIY